VDGLRGELAEFVADVFGSFPRRDQRRWGECYLRGLMLDGRRKSIQPMAERLPDGNMQAPTDALPHLGNDTSSITHTSGLITADSRSATRCLTGSGSHGDWFTNCGAGGSASPRELVLL
jgi:hypothetical protein